MNNTERIPNARKWTVEVVSAHLDAIEREGRESVIPFLSFALRKQGLHKHVWSYWKRIFADNDDIIEKIMFIDSMYESKICELAIRKQLDRVIALRTLKFVYKWSHKDRES